MSYKVTSIKKSVPTDSIIIPRYYNQPKLEKILQHYGRYVLDNHLDPIIVDDKMQLIDGYCSLLILQTHGHTTVDVCQILVKDHSGNQGVWLVRGNGEIYCPVCLNVAAVCNNPNEAEEVMYGVHYCSYCGSRNLMSANDELSE